MRILALDLGTKTGWAFHGEGERHSGTWLLASEPELRQQRKEKRDRCCDVRFGRLVASIRQLTPLDYIYFEDVQFLTSQAQSQLWAGFRAVVTLYGQERIKIVAVPVGTLKKFATGKGNAKKEEMAAAWYKSRDAEVVVQRDDNEIDALHLLNFALTELKIWNPK